jgi:hypothetical protein
LEERFSFPNDETYEIDVQRNIDKTILFTIDKNLFVSVQELS